MRICFLDNLKTLAIILVVMTHAAVTYSGIGSWFYTEHSNLSNASYYFFLFFQSFTQAFFMSLLFGVAGYFVPDSLAKKGIKKFIASRTFRLGLPALIFALFIFPICAKMVSPSFNLNYYLHGIISFRFIGWTGPLWFTLALLFFTLIYIAGKRWFDILTAKFTFNITVKNFLVLILLIGVIAFVIRLIFPIGTSVINFQFCFFSAYVFMFLMGIFARQKNILDKIAYPQAKKWGLIAFGVGIPWWILIVYFGVSIQGNETNLTLLMGGWNWVALSYALWASFFCVAIIIALLGIFKKIFNKQNSFLKFLSSNSFGVYVFHAPILIAVSVLLKNVDLPPILKWIIVFSIVLPFVFIFVHFIRKIQLIRKIFS
ncbi:MAG: hypothetical protein KR126chlam6_01415 [Candidatus Anoxychlamydiales bacterium]|nr:hypothetical protein [Candidatus Anoxychlamydiales bacterium]